MSVGPVKVDWAVVLLAGSGHGASTGEPRPLARRIQREQVAHTMQLTVLVDVVVFGTLVAWHPAAGFGVLAAEQAVIASGIVAAEEAALVFHILPALRD